MEPVQKKPNDMPEGVLRRRIEIANKLIQKFASSDEPGREQLLASLRDDIRRTEQAISEEKKSEPKCFGKGGLTLQTFRL